MTRTFEFTQWNYLCCRLKIPSIVLQAKPDVSKKL